MSARVLAFALVAAFASCGSDREPGPPRPVDYKLAAELACLSDCDRREKEHGHSLSCTFDCERPGVRWYPLATGAPRQGLIGEDAGPAECARRFGRAPDERWRCRAILLTPQPDRVRYEWRVP